MNRGNVAMEISAFPVSAEELSRDHFGALNSQSHYRSETSLTTVISAPAAVSIEHRAEADKYIALYLYRVSAEQQSTGSSAFLPWRRASQASVSAGAHLIDVPGRAAVKALNLRNISS